MKTSLKALATAGALTAALAAAGTANAAAPTGAYTDFAQCQYDNPAVSYCLYSKSSSGAFQFGKANVPITSPIVFQGGYGVSEDGYSFPFTGARNGQTLSRTKLPVPGGLLGLMDTSKFGGPLLALFRSAVKAGNDVTATPELVGPPKFDLNAFFTGDAPVITLPVRVKLDNPFLGSKCYIGTTSKPVTLQVRTGTTTPPAPNKPITGSTGDISVDDNAIVADNVKLVDNAFSVPAATDCGYLPLDKLLITGAVNLKEGLPSAAGKNSAMLNGVAKLADTESVRDSVK